MHMQRVKINFNSINVIHQKISLANYYKRIRRDHGKFDLIYQIRKDFIHFFKNLSPFEPINEA